MSSEIATKTTVSAQTIEKVLLGGNLEDLSPADRLAVYTATCESLGLNPLTRPFDYLKLNGKLTLYARRDATDQLRKINNVSITKLERDRMDDLYVVTATASLPDGRSDSALGAVPIAGLKGEALANAFMKAETKAKRRVTLSICGLGLTDDSEVDSIPGSQRVESQVIDRTTGEITEPPKLAPKADKPKASRDEKERAYLTLISKARELNVEDAFLTPLNDEWSDAELEAEGRLLQDIYLQAKNTHQVATPA